MQENKFLLVNRDERGVVTLTLNRPELRNAFDDGLIAELTTTLKSLANDSQVRIVQLNGAGKIFCAGADLNWMQRMVDYSYEENLADAENLAELMYTLDEMPKPTIAMVQGGAYGGGVGLVACCDIALATPSAQFCLSETKLGLIPAVIAPFVLAKIGEKAMRRYSLTAEAFSADQAKTMNLIDEVVEPENLAARAEALTSILLKNAPDAMTHMKQLLQTISHVHQFDNVREETVAAIAARRVSAEGQEGLKAFLEKRNPNWSR